MVIISLIISLGFLLFYVGPVQTYAAKLAANYLHKKTQIDISIEKLQVRFPNSIIINDLLVKDLSGDTLIYTKELLTSFVEMSPDYSKLYLGSTSLLKPYFNLITPINSEKSNLDDVIDLIPSSGDSSANPFSLYIAGVNLEQGRFNLLNADTTINDRQIDFNALKISRLNSEIPEFELVGDSLFLEIESFTALDPQGLDLRMYHGDFIYSSHGMHFREFMLQTPNSKLSGNLVFDYQHPSELSDFSRKVFIDADLAPSMLSLQDLGIFVPQLKQVEDDVFLRGLFQGRIAELSGNDVLIEWGESSVFRGDFYTYGLPEIEETFIDFEVASLNTDYQDIKFFEKITGDSLSIFIPEDVAKLGPMAFKGNFTGFINEFVAYGELNTALGGVDSDISLKKVNDTVRFSGEINCSAFDLGSFFENEKVGALTAGLTLNGQGFSLERLKAKAVGEIRQFSLNGYDYEKLELDGVFENKKFKGYINSLDPNLNFAFNGLVDFNKKIPAYDFQADLYNVDLSGLNLLPDSLASSFTGSVSIKAKGSNPKNFSGSLFAENISYCDRNEEYFLGNIDLNTTTGAEQQIDLKSSIGSIFIKGKIDYEYLAQDLYETLEDVSSVYFAEKQVKNLSTGQDFTLECYLTNASILSGVLNKDFGAEGSLQLLGYFRSQASQIGFNAHGQRVSFGSNKFDHLVIEGSKNGMVTDLWINSEDVVLSNKLNMGQVDFSLKGVDDNFQSSLYWENPNITAGNLKGIITIQGKNKGQVDWLPSRASFREQSWNLGELVTMYWDSAGLYFNNFALYNSNQQLNFSGTLGAKLKNTEINLFCENFNLNNLDAFTGGEPSFAGVANGTADFSFIEDSLHLETDFLIDTLKLNDKLVGDVSIKTEQKSGWNRIGINGAVIQNKEKARLDFYGYFDTDSKENPIMLTLDFKKFDLAFLEGQFTTDVTQLGGKIDGSLSLKGKPSEPKFKGKLKISNGHVFIPYLMTGFSFSDQIVIQEDYLGLNYIDIYDDKGRKAKLTGTVLHENFAQWNYDFAADLNNTQVLNTNRKDNSTFYGTAFLTGTLNISGYGSNTSIEVAASPEKGTKINIPLDEIEDVETLDYVEFINPNEEEKEEEIVDLSGLDLKLDFDLNTNAEINLIFDEAVGDIIKTVGTGSIKMDIDSRQNFEMFGKYNVVDGDYLFTLENLVNKKFNIQQGSSINWFGDPYEALLDIKAYYEVRAPLYDILVAADDRFKRREPVLVQMQLTERLVNPEIKFDIILPNSDDFIRGQVKSAISSEQEMNRQVFSLLVLNRFVPPLNSTASNEGSRIGTSTLGSSGSELLSNQISNIFSQISSDFNLGINYRSGDQLTRSEVAVAMSTQIWNERVQVSSNLGVTDRTSSNPNGLVGDLTVEYSLTKDGKVRLKAFNETADNSYSGSNLSPFIQGLGINYRTEFDNLGELWRNFKKRIRSRKEEGEENPK